MSDRETLYVRADLEEYADLDAIDDDPSSWGTPSRSELLQQSLGLDSVEIHVASTGGYQGEKLFVFRTGGYYWLVKDSYGSCSHCDGLLAADHASEYATTMLRDAYAFTDAGDTIAFLERKANDDGGYGIFGWATLADDGVEAVRTESERTHT